MKKATATMPSPFSSSLLLSPSFFVFFAAQRSEEGNSSIATVAFFLCFFFAELRWSVAMKAMTAMLLSPFSYVFFSYTAAA